MKILIAGSRNIKDFDFTELVPEETELIVTGGANGIDKCAEAFADLHGISKLVLRPNYKKYRKAAPLLRNRMMVDICDIAIIVWDGTSRGTKYTIDYAKETGKKVLLTILNT